MQFADHLSLISGRVFDKVCAQTMDGGVEHLVALAKTEADQMIEVGAVERGGDLVVLLHPRARLLQDEAPPVCFDPECEIHVPVARAIAAQHGLATRHDVCRNLIRVWIEKFEAGAFDEDQEAASSLRAYQAKIAALERKVGQLTMELDLLKKGQRFARRPRSGSSSIVSGPPLERAAAASVKDAAS